MTTPPLPRKSIAEAVAEYERGNLSQQELAEAILESTSEREISAVRADLDRVRRCGAPEVVFAEGKSVDSLIAAIDNLLDQLPCAGFEEVLVTRINVEQARHIGEKYAHVAWDARARTMRIGIAPAIKSADEVQSNTIRPVNVVCAGTADLPVAMEARETLAWMGVPSRLVADVGVAGVYRLIGQLPILRDSAANIVVAGMEGALPSVVGGLVATPVIAVPTSVGYGTNFAGLTALLGMLNSCAANVCVVNIDAGFKAAFVAGLMARSAKGT